ncbi:MAG: DNA polymerase III subunit beta, partial [Oscillospiraceae bacterium]
YRLAICKKEGLGLTEEKSFIVPAKTLIETSRLIADSDCEVQIATARRYAVFTFGAYTVVTRLLEGDFLDYKKSIPDGWRTRVKIDVRALFDAVERAALIVNERFKSPVKLFFDNNRAVITCATALGNSYDEIDCELEGDAVEISFNNKYLLDALRYSGCDEIYLEIGGSTAPMKVVPTEGTDFLFLVLPVRTKSDRA